MMKLITTAFIFLCCHLTLAQSFSKTEERIDSLFAGYHTATPGVAIAVVKDSDIIFKKGYGSANLEYQIPIQTNTVFHAASVSKQFTAFAIYLLKDRGLLALDDDVRKYIPELPDYGHKISITQLLAHTSGLRDQWALLTLAGWRLEDVITQNQVLKLTYRQQGLNFEPGTQLSYNNTGYLLMAEIVKRVSGLSMRDFAHKEIFAPLGMSNTQFYDDYHRLVPNRAYSYELKNGAYVKKRLNFSNVGATSLFTTVEDLAKWAHNFEQPTVGNYQLISEFNEISRLRHGEKAVLRVLNGDTLYHAKGQLFRNYRGVQVYKHGGHDAGYRAFLSRYPDENMAIITLSNDEHYEIFARGMELAEFYLGHKMKKPSTTSGRVANTPKKPSVYSAPFTDFTGTYYSPELDTHYEVLSADEQLVINHKRLPDMALTRIGEDAFTGRNPFGFKIEFQRDGFGKVDGFKISNFGVTGLRFEKKQ